MSVAFSPDNVYVSRSICIKDVSSRPKDGVSNPTSESRTFYVWHYSKIPRRIALPQKLRLAQLVRKFPAFYGKENGITYFT